MLPCMRLYTETGVNMVFMVGGRGREEESVGRKDVMEGGKEGKEREREGGVGSSA